MLNNTMLCFLEVNLLIHFVEWPLHMPEFGIVDPSQWRGTELKSNQTPEELLERYPAQLKLLGISICQIVFSEFSTALRGLPAIILVSIRDT